jgi:hypothetical protein
MAAKLSGLSTIFGSISRDNMLSIIALKIVYRDFEYYSGSGIELICSGLAF